MPHLPPNYRKAGGYHENLDAPQCYNCVFLRTHQGRYTCKRYVAYILISFICDDWQKRPEALGLDKLELREDELKTIERHQIRDFQKAFPTKAGAGRQCFNLLCDSIAL